jgi:hypothetical protein
MAKCDCDDATNEVKMSRKSKACLPPYILKTATNLGR